ncbi:glycosyltransferase family 4 protein [Actinoplanes sp. NPDC049118]|uniref:glycosyltransferase family 4 protein n=1 Tax=Actinoplanes sp. NPDC049118 TaxID=3155769 RepID=UPI00340F0436
MTEALHVVLPGAIDDPAAPSGGNTYDRRVLTGLAADRDVHEIAVPAPWPHPRAADSAALARALAELPDGAVVLLDGLVGCAVPELLEPHRARVRLVVLVHLPLGDETGLSGAEAAELTARERRTLHAAAAVVATSSGAARRLETLHDLPAGSVHVAAPGVDPAPPAAPSPEGGRLLCVAAVTPRKAQDVLVTALRSVADLPWTCTLVGALDRAPAFTDRVRELVAAADGARDRIHLAGTRTGPALERSYAEADLLVLPSLAETYGMVVTEALARGVPVLGTRVDGVPEALGSAGDGTTPGELVPPGDPEALAAALRRWLTDPRLRRSWRASARHRRDGLRGWDETTRRLSEVLYA